MFTMTTNKQRLFYANLVSTEDIVDEYGNRTGETRAVYSSPAEFFANVSAGSGQLESEVFGTKSDYSKTIVVTGECPFTKGSVLWIGVEATTTEGDDTVNPYNYTVVGEAVSLNSTTFAIKEVTTS